MFEYRCLEDKVNTWEFIKSLYWKNTFLNEKQKEAIFYNVRSIIKGKQNKSNTAKIESSDKYIEQILNIQNFNNEFSIEYPKLENKFLGDQDVKLLAYYLPQYYPDEHNNKWWGKGSTEWTNVSKSMPQYIGHYQPRLPGELGFYDLRVQDNIYRQIELAQIYGIYGFCFYYYWFNGVRLLDLPFDNFVNDKTINFPFCICWVNETWTKQWSSSSNTPLIEIPKDVNVYKRFIESCYEIFKKENYITIEDKIVLIIYKPLDIPNRKEVISYWREFVLKTLGKSLYIIAADNIGNVVNNYDTIEGFDAISEFGPGPKLKYMNDITETKKYVCERFYGKIYDYKDFVYNKKYFKITGKKLYRSISPMWDNTSRRKDKGVILDGSTPELYKQWLRDIIVETKNNKNLDDNIIFINAWNEWAEGAYLEPDLKWKYGYLEATRNAIIETR